MWRILRAFEHSLQDIRLQRLTELTHLQQMSLRPLTHHCIMHATGVPDELVIPDFQDTCLVGFLSRSNNWNIQDLTPRSLFRVGQHNTHMTFVGIMVSAKQKYCGARAKAILFFQLPEYLPTLQAPKCVAKCLRHSVHRERQKFVDRRSVSSLYLSPCTPNNCHEYNF